MRRRNPVLITDAQPSQQEELRRRERRYLLMMGLRIVCLVLGTVLVMVRAPLLWLWLILCGVGMVVLPWLAVILANDRPPKVKHRFRPHRAGAASRELPAQQGPAADRTIDAGSD